MAVSLTLAEAAVAARIVTDGDAIPSPVQTAAQVLYDACKAQVEAYAPAAPDSVQDAALVRMLAYLWQADAAANPRGYQSALRNSGATGLLAQWRKRRAGLLGGEQAAVAPAPTPGGDTPGGDTPGGGIDEAAVNALIDKRIEEWALKTGELIPDNRIPAEIARDSEVTGAVSDEAAKRNAAIAAVMPRLLPELPGAGARDGKVPKFDGDALHWEPSGLPPDETGSPYARYAAPRLAPTDITASTAIPASGGGLVVSLLAATLIPGGVIPNRDFVTEWEGAVSGRCDTAGTLHVTLVTGHEFNGKSLSHRRELAIDVAAGTTFFFGMGDFNSRSRVREGAYGGIEITAADLRADAEISYALEITLTGRRSDTRKQGSITELYFSDVQTASYQLGALGEDPTDQVARDAASDAQDEATAANKLAQRASDQARDVQHLAEDNQAHIDALEDGGLLAIGYGEWADWTVAEYNAGFRLATSQNNTFSAGRFHGGTNTFSGAASNRRIAISVPPGVDVARVRLQLTLNGSKSTKPTGQDEAWLPFTPEGGDSTRDYYYLGLISTNNHVVITFGDGDIIVLQIRPLAPVMDMDGVARIRSLSQAVQDIVVGDVVDTDWEDVNSDGSEGGVSQSRTGYSVSTIKSATYAAPAITATRDSVQGVRIPAAADPRHYRLIVEGTGTELLSHFRRLTHDDDWQYYEQGVFLTESARVTLQLDDRTLGHTTFDGVLGPNAAASLPPATADVSVAATKLFDIEPAAAATKFVSLTSGQITALSNAWTDPKTIAIQLEYRKNAATAAAAVGQIMKRANPDETRLECFAQLDQSSFGGASLEINFNSDGTVHSGEVEERGTGASAARKARFSLYKVALA